MKIAIIGSCIGGLAAAALLKRVGTTFTSRSGARFSRVGAGIQCAERRQVLPVLSSRTPRGIAVQS